MEIYDLNFNAFIVNLEHEQLSMFCPKSCKLIDTLKADLGVEDTNDETYSRDTDTLCCGKIYKTCNIRRIPTVHVVDYDKYYDITLINVNPTIVQLVIVKLEKPADPIVVVDSYDRYKLFYEYVGGISDLKSRVGYECEFMAEVNNSTLSREDAFNLAVYEKIIGKMLE